jgi:hypothetical protein
MSTSDTNIVKIIKSCTELRADQWVGWWIKLSCNTIWLEAENTCSNVINIISPSSDYWISVDRCARDSCGGEALLETFPSISKCDFLTIFTETISDE